MTSTQLGVPSLPRHYCTLLYYALFRFRGENYKAMRQYFAGLLAGEVEEFMSLSGARVLDVGGGKGEFCQVLQDVRDCVAVNLDLTERTFFCPRSMVGSGDAIPSQDDTYDLVISRGVLEHVPPQVQPRIVAEMFRVLRPGGVGYVMIPPWWNPHAGHHMKPFHIFPFHVAKRLRTFFFRNQIRGASYAEELLHPITFARMDTMLRQAGFRPLATRDTHFRLHFLTRIPLLREIAVPAVAFLVTK